MWTCENCVHSIKVSDKVQCTHPSKWGMLMDPLDTCDNWEADQ